MGIQNSFKFVLELEKIPIQGVDIKKIPGVEAIEYKNVGRLFVIKYFITNKHGTVLYGFTSKTKDFKQLYSMDLYDQQLQPVIAFDFESLPSDKFYNELPKIFQTTKPRKLKKPITESEMFVEGMLDEEKFEYYLMRVVPFITAAFYVLIIGSIISFYVKKVRNIVTEKRVETILERKLNDELFKNQTGKEPAFKIYSDLVTYIKYIVHGSAKSIIVCGPPGMSKTYNVKRVFYFEGLKPGKDYIIAKGSSLGLAETYSLFYKYRDKIVVLDDFDTPLKNEETINMLKALTDSYSRRFLSLPREKMMSSGQEGSTETQVPEKFEFTGKLIIITNIPKNQIDRALLSRSPAIEVNFDTKQCINSISQMLEYMRPGIPMTMKQEVLDYIMELYKKDSHISVDFRGFQSAIEARYGVPMNWKDMTKIIVNYQGK